MHSTEVVSCHATLMCSVPISVSLTSCRITNTSSTCQSLLHHLKQRRQSHVTPEEHLVPHAVCQLYLTFPSTPPHTVSAAVLTLTGQGLSGSVPEVSRVAVSPRKHNYTNILYSLRNIYTYSSPLLLLTESSRIKYTERNTSPP